ncbi:RNA recognition motif 2-domain-containing protein [Naematelia encephala]|uniref:RNA recognition motif 2-domain-containing protein n=1 Tax=Naematelia encephala TaxID=71784 RepID=A0A1Y2BGL8_9TREE|nr:RNA recognition motif 2-domain-containing protein [Naematelia encephala]
MSAGHIRTPVGPSKPLNMHPHFTSRQLSEGNSPKDKIPADSPTTSHDPINKQKKASEAHPNTLSAPGGPFMTHGTPTKAVTDTPQELLKMSRLSMSERSSTTSSEGDSRRSAPATFHTSRTPPRLDWTPRTPNSRLTLTSQQTPSTAATLPPVTPKSLWSTQSPRGSVSSFKPWLSTSSSGQSQEAGEIEPMQATDFHMKAFVSGPETAEELGRYVMICDIPKDVTPQQIREMTKSVAEIKAIAYKHLRTKGCVIVLFYDPRQALKVYDTLRTTTVRFYVDGPLVAVHCVKIEKEVVQQTTGDEGEWQEIWAASDSVLLVKISGQSGISNDGMKGVLSRLGDVQRFQPIGHTGKIFVVEFWDTRDASHAIDSLSQLSQGDFNISATYYDTQAVQRLSRKPSPPAQQAAGTTLGSAAYRPDSFIRNFDRTTSLPPQRPRVGWQVDDLFSTPQPPQPAGQLHRDYQWSEGELNHEYAFGTPITANTGVSDGYEGGLASQFRVPAHLTAMSRRITEPGALQGILDQVDISARAKRGQGIGGHWHPNDRQAIPERNRVFPERIVSGLDGRTTVMIKDVPNKLSRQELVDILSEVVPGDFDFVYLRFDFKNCCNVGYAFVNFTTVGALWTFIKARVGKKWNLFSSEKVLQVSYANIQGKAALINKFRNSAVMDVIEPWRPQIFYSSGSMKGRPEPFPTSDNLSFRERSTQARLSGLSQSYPVEDTFESGDQYNYSSRPFDGYTF